MEQSSVLYQEIQAYNSKSGRKLLTIFNAIILSVCIVLLIWNRSTYRGMIYALLAIAVVINLIGLLFLRTRLITQIRIDGIYVKYAPFHSRFNVFKWEDIEELFIREYNPMREYGGWGIRMGPGGEAFNVAGNKGLQIVFRNGRRLLIGINDLEGMKRIVDYVHKHHVK